MTGDLLVIVPSRNRPRNIARLLDAIHETSRIKTHLHVCVDDDDPELENYRYVFGKAGRDDDVLESGPRNGLAAWTDEIAVRRAGEYPFLASLGDDHVPVTPGWDRALVKGILAMGGTGITYPWDNTREDIPEAVVMSSDIVTALGWMTLPGLDHWYIDNVWADLGRGAGCLRHLRAVKVQHDWKGDQVSKESSAKLAADRDTYYAWRRSGQMKQDVDTVISLREARVLQPA